MALFRKELPLWLTYWGTHNQLQTLRNHPFRWSPTACKEFYSWSKRANGRDSSSILYAALFPKRPLSAPIEFPHFIVWPCLDGSSKYWSSKEERCVSKLTFFAWEVCSRYWRERCWKPYGAGNSGKRDNYWNGLAIYRWSLRTSPCCLLISARWEAPHRELFFWQQPSLYLYIISFIENNTIITML